jgi:hypothetical protein
MAERLITPSELDAELVKGYARLEVDEGLDGRVADDFGSGLSDEGLLESLVRHHGLAVFHLLTLAGLTREADRRIALRDAQRDADA